VIIRGIGIIKRNSYLNNNNNNNKKKWNKKKETSKEKEMEKLRCEI